MRLPRILRILVIDDLAGKDAMGETIRNSLYAMVKTCDVKGALDYVDIEFADTPEKGIKKWQEEVFDLTLFDSNFDTDLEVKEESKQTRQVGTLTSYTDYYARYKGLLAFQVVQTLLSTLERYAYRAQTSHVYVWSSLDYSDVSEVLGSTGRIDAQKRTKEGLPEDAAPSSGRRYLAKLPRAKKADAPATSNGADQPETPELVLDALKTAVGTAVGTALSDLSPQQRAERFVALYKIRERLPHKIRWQPFLDGYLISSKREKPLPYLDEILCPDTDSATGVTQPTMPEDGEGGTEPVAASGNNHKKRDLYFTIRKPRLSDPFNPDEVARDTAMPDKESSDITLSAECRVVHLGPSSRDIGRPLAAIVDRLFPENEDDQPRHSQKRTDKEPEQLSTKQQLDLLYRNNAQKKPFEWTQPKEDADKSANTPEAKQKGESRRAYIEAAATPLTGASAVGLKHARSVLIEKTKALLSGPFDRVVLKTVYLDSPAHRSGPGPSEGGTRGVGSGAYGLTTDETAANRCKVGNGQGIPEREHSATPQASDAEKSGQVDEGKPVYEMPEWQGLQWPALQAQSHHRTRCLRSVGHTRTIWNTGVTALEMFTPKMLNDFLQECAKQADTSGFGNQCENVVISLGSKYPQSTNVDACYRREGCDIQRHEAAFRDDLCGLIWEPLFDIVFKGLDKLLFQTVEINVRHYLRENIAFHIGGDEYMSPDAPGGKFSETYKTALTEFSWWVEVVNKVATKNKKRLILKFPFRSDIFAFIDVVLDFCQQQPPAERGFGIQGICLINAFKSGVCEMVSAPEFSPAWYSLPWAWGDAAGREVKYQMSGEMLNASRNMLLFKLLDARHRNPRLKDLELHFGGGVVSLNDLDFCLHPSGFGGVRRNMAVQIGTWALLDFKLGVPLPLACQTVAPNIRRNKARATGKCDGKKCSPCVKDRCLQKAIMDTGIALSVDSDKCIKCGFCVDTCPSRNFEEIVDDSTSLVAPRKPSRTMTPSISADKCVGCSKCTRSDMGGCKSGVLAMLPAPTPEKPKKQMAAVAEGCVANCTACGRCVEACDHWAITLKSTATPEFLPRICYLLHERCVGCGKCSRSFYCDTFLDRRGGDIHPLMDPRNCTGCGLCAQICPSGALQLFSPEHVAVLISGPGERTEVLKAMQIPHLTYDPIEDLHLFDWGAGDTLRERARSFMDGKVAPTNEQLLAWSIDLWSYRLVHDRFSPHSGFGADRRWKNWIGVEMPKDLTTDHMAEIKKVSGKRAASLWNSLTKDIDAGMEIVSLRAFVWSQLIWSDPGQVLWESPIIVARTTAQSTGMGDAMNDLPYSAESVKSKLLGVINDNSFSILNDWVVLRCGEVQKKGIDTPAVRHSEIEGLSLRLSADQVAAYADARFGKGRLLGLDLRACPEMLGRNAKRLDECAIMSVSGLPWHDMRALSCLKGIEAERDKRLTATRMLRP